jgi:hypothetical protein
VATILNQIYEEDSRGFSYGFRRGRGQHDALDALSYALLKKKVNYILDVDVRSFFDNLDKGWMIRFIEHRVAPVPLNMPMSAMCVQSKSWSRNAALNLWSASSWIACSAVSANIASGMRCYLFHHHSVLCAFHPPRRVPEMGRDSPQRNK